MNRPNFLPNVAFSSASAKHSSFLALILHHLVCVCVCGPKRNTLRYEIVDEDHSWYQPQPATMVYSRGETTSFNPFWSEETETTTINTPAGYPSPFDQTIPLALSSIPVGVGGAGGNGNSSRSRPSTSRRGMASGNGSVMTTTSWADDFYWRTEETATTDLAWRVDTPTIASSRSSYYPHNPPVPHPPPPMVDTSLESQDHYFFDDEMYDYEKDRVNNLAFQTDPSRSFFPKIVTSMDRSQATTIPSVSIVIQERLSILFDGLSPDPSCRVMGRIYVRGSGWIDTTM